MFWMRLACLWALINSLNSHQAHQAANTMAPHTITFTPQVTGHLAVAGGEVAELGDLKAEGHRVEERGLLGVAHAESDVVDVDQLEGVGVVGGLSGIVRCGD